MSPESSASTSGVIPFLLMSLPFGVKYFCDGNLYRTAIGKWLDGLHHAFSISSCPYDGSNPVVLHCSRKNLRCTGTVSVYQNSQRYIQFIFSVAGFLFPFSVFVLCINDQSFRKDLAEYITNCIQNPPGLSRRSTTSFFIPCHFKICKCFFILITGYLGKLGDPDITGVSGKHLMGNSLDLHIPGFPL